VVAPGLYFTGTWFINVVREDEEWIGTVVKPRGSEGILQAKYTVTFVPNENMTQQRYFGYYYTGSSNFSRASFAINMTFKQLDVAVNPNFDWLSQIITFNLDHDITNMAIISSHYGSSTTDEAWDGFSSDIERLAADGDDGVTTFLTSEWASDYIERWITDHPHRHDKAPYEGKMKPGKGKWLDTPKGKGKHVDHQKGGKPAYHQNQGFGKGKDYMNYPYQGMPQYYNPHMMPPGFQQQNAPPPPPVPEAVVVKPTKPDTNSNESGRSVNISERRLESEFLLVQDRRTFIWDSDDRELIELTSPFTSRLSRTRTLEKLKEYRVAVNHRIRRLEELLRR